MTHHTKKERLALLLKVMEKLLVWVHSREGHTALTVSQCRENPCWWSFEAWAQAREGEW